MPHCSCSAPGKGRLSLRRMLPAFIVFLVSIAAPVNSAVAQWSADAAIGVRALPGIVRQLSDVPPPVRDDPGAPSAPAVAGQLVLGTLATPAGYVGGGLATRWVATRLGASEDAARKAAYVGAYSGAAIATAATVEFLGRTGRVEGSFPATLGGAVAGELASWGVVELGRTLFRDSPDCNLFCNVLGASAFVLPSVGATVGHALSREWR